MHEGDRLAKLVGFLHIVRGHQDRGAEFLAQVPNILPDGLLRNRVEADGGLIKKKNAWMVEHGLGDFEAANHAA